jgi:hypothetical protein
MWYMLDGLGVETGIRLEALETSAWICERLGRSNGSKVSLARGLVAAEAHKALN